MAILFNSGHIKTDSHKIVVRSSQQDTLDLGFILLGPLRQGVPPPTILSEHNALNVESPRLVATLQLRR